MDSAIYIGSSGAQETYTALSTTINNIANIGTAGFKADKHHSHSFPVLASEVAKDNGAMRVYARTKQPGSDFTPGAIHYTDNPLDIAVKNEGWIAVQARDGSEAYTRAGNLTLTPEGMLVTSGGLPVMGNGGTIVIPEHEQLDISEFGIISVIPMGSESTNLTEVDRIKLVNPPLDTLKKGQDGLFRRNDGQAAEADASVMIVSGGYEESNVDIARSMAEMIELSRSLEMQIKLMKTMEEHAAASARLLQVS